MVIPLISKAIESAIIRELYFLGNSVATRARDNASWSKDIPKAIKLGDVQMSNGRYSIDIIIDARKDGPAPQAAAFEYGSGLHDPTRRQTYPIRPDQATMLAFEWNPKRVPYGSKKFIGKIGDTFLFRYVDHPGVAARPYMRPAIEQVRKTFRSRLMGAVSKAYRESLVRVEVIK